MSLNLDRLNSRQREAVLHGDGPILVLAGAGSGKTSTMAYRIAHLVTARHIAPSNVLGLSFTNKAATELKERVNGLITRVSGPKSSRGLTVTTFHSLCVRILRQHGHHLGFQTNFTILDRNDQKDILKQILRYIKVDDRKFDVDVLLFEIGQAKSRFLRGEEAQSYFLENKRLGTDYGIVAASAYPKYQDQLKALNAMDFDDLLFHGVGLLETSMETRHHYNALFRYILVDEYQDTNPTQFKLLRLLTERSQNLCVVGDDDQSIYSWRGADSTHILEFVNQFPGARVITLDQNYRSTQTILEAANGVIKNNDKRHPKELWSERGSGSAIIETVVEDDRGEGEFVASEIFKLAHENEGQRRPWKDFAVLYRSNAQSRVFEEALRRHAVPYKIIGGYSFLDLKEVKDVLSYWRLIANLQDDASLRRIINWPSRGIGKSTIEALGDFAFKNEKSLFEALAEGPRIVSQRGSKGAAGLESLRALLVRLREELEQTPPESLPMVNWARRSLELIGARRAMDEEVEDPIQAAKKWENVEELLHSIGQFIPEEETLPSTQAFLQQFLNRMTLDAQAEEEDQKDAQKESKADQVTLLTLHGAKGLEYPIVFLVGMEDGLLPHKKTVEEATDYSEERRLCYVGITRARDQLYLVRARNRIRYGKPVPRTRSRFMNEIPTGTLVQKDLSHGPDKSDSVEARQAHETQVKDYLSNIRAMLEKNRSP